MIPILKLIDLNKVVQSNNSLFQQTDKIGLTALSSAAGCGGCWPELVCNADAEPPDVDCWTPNWAQQTVSHNCPITAVIDEVTIENNSTQNWDFKPTQPLQKEINLESNTLIKLHIDTDMINIHIYMQLCFLFICLVIAYILLYNYFIIAIIY